MMLTGTFRQQAKSFLDKHFLLSCCVIDWFFLHQSLAAVYAPVTHIQSTGCTWSQQQFPWFRSCSRNLRHTGCCRAPKPWPYYIMVAPFTTPKWCTLRIKRLTWGGGSPPAPGGQSGNMIVRLGVLHWQEGEGLDMLQFPLRKMSATDWSIRWKWIREIYRQIDFYFFFR